ncbi:MAG: FxsA family protein [Candidatus Omnitrophota bacterium]
MIGYLILLFTLVPVAELVILIKAGSYIGAGWTIAIVIIITGITGAYLAKFQGLRTLALIQEDINRGHMPADRLFDGFLILCGGLLLLTPGFITDFIGFMALIPFVRNWLKGFIKSKTKDMINKGRVITITSFKSF